MPAYPTTQALVASPSPTSAVPVFAPTSTPSMAFKLSVADDADGTNVADVTGGAFNTIATAQTAGETELVIIVTPYVVRPTSRDALARPDDGFMPDAEIESAVIGRLNRVYGDPSAPPPGSFQGDIGFIIE